MKKIISLSILSLAASLTAQTTTDSASVQAVVPAPAPVVAQIDTQALADLDLRVKVLERLRENDVEERTADKAKASKLDISTKGFRFDDPKGEYFLKIGGLAQPTAQYFFNDSAKKLVNNYSLRRARLDVQTGLGKGITFRLQSEFAPGTSAALLDAYVDLQPAPQYGLRVGRFTPPIGLEYTISAAKYSFLDVSFASNLVPVRDLGVQVQGDIGEGALVYSVGIFNGTIDGNRLDADLEDEKEVVGRVWATPFISQAPSALSGISLGFGASAGKQYSAPASYKSTGRNKVFNYKSADTLQGWQVRLVPQAAVFEGSFGLYGEFAIEKQGLRDSLNQNQGRLQNQAWEATASYVITGEDASLKGVSPSKPINGSEDGIGAIEVVARIQQLAFDKDAFQTWADSTKSVKSVLGIGGGVNWYATKNIRFSGEYSLNKYKAGLKVGDRKTEHLVTATTTVSF